MSLAVLLAADGAPWEASLLAELAADPAELQIARRCVDIVDLLAVAASGQGQAALVDARLRRLDADAVQRLAAVEVAVVGVTGPDGAHDENLLRAAGISFVVAGDAGAQVIASVVQVAVADQRGDVAASHRTFANPSFVTRDGVPAADDPATAPPVGDPPPEVPSRRGSIVAVWGPTGAPGRTTVAVGIADELSRRQLPTLLVDADVYGGVMASVLGLLDESAGIAAACRQAQSRRLDEEALAALAWQLSASLRVLTGVARADRWPELRPQGIEGVLGVARSVADFTVVDLGFCLESDEELSFDTLAPRRNGATLAVLDQADLVLAVGSADPVGIQRLVRGLSELREAEVTAPVWVVLNRVRGQVVPGELATELQHALQRYAGHSPAAYLPVDLDAVDGALAAGKTLAEFAPNSPLRRSIRELAMAVAGVEVKARGRRRR